MAHINIIGQLYINDSVTIGPSKAFMGYDSRGQEFIFHLDQHYLLDDFSEGVTAGRLHVNKTPLKVRSEQEMLTLQKIEESIIKPKGAEASYKETLKLLNQKQITSTGEAQKLGIIPAIAMLVNMVLDFVHSDEYIEVAKAFN
ncbi:MAG: hypothetical protein ACPGJS_13985 [Flammeovirgaceae bacterium]